MRWRTDLPPFDHLRFAFADGRSVGMPTAVYERVYADANATFHRRQRQAVLAAGLLLLAVALLRK